MRQIFEGKFSFFIMLGNYLFWSICDVFTKIAVCKPEAATLPEGENNLPSIETICFPNLIILAVPSTLPSDNGL